MTRAKADLLLVVCAAIWGYAFYCQKIAMAHISPLAFVAFRSLVAALALAPIAHFEGGPERATLRQVLPLGFATGVVFFVGSILQQTGIVTATVTNAGFLTSLYVVLTPFAAWAFLNQKPGPVVYLCTALAFIGAWALGGGTIGGFSHGDWLIAICALVWTVHISLTGAASSLERPALFTAIQFAVAGILAFAGLAVTEPFPAPENVYAALGSILFVGLFSSAFCFTVFTAALRATSAAEAAIILSIENVFCAAAGYFLLGERLPALGWFGASLIVASALAVQLVRPQTVTDKQQAAA